MNYYKLYNLTFLENSNKNKWCRIYFTTSEINDAKKHKLLYLDQSNSITYCNSIDYVNIKLISKILNKKWLYK